MKPTYDMIATGAKRAQELHQTAANDLRSSGNLRENYAKTTRKPCIVEKDKDTCVHDTVSYPNENY